MRVFVMFSEFNLKKKADIHSSMKNNLCSGTSIQYPQGCPRPRMKLIFWEIFACELNVKKSLQLSDYQEIQYK